MGVRSGVIALVVLFALTDSAAGQQGTDASVAIQMRTAGSSSQQPASVPVGTQVSFQVSFGWLAGVARDVSVEINIPGDLEGYETKDRDVVCSGSHPIVCRVDREDFAFHASLEIATTQSLAGRQTATARITTSTPDVSPFNNWAETKLDVLGAPSLVISGWRFEPNRLDAAATGSVFLTMANRGATATNVRVMVTSLRGARLTGAVMRPEGGTCSVAPETIACTRPSLGPLLGTDIEATFTTAEDLDGSEVVLQATVTSDEPDVDPTDNAKEVRTPIIPQIRVTSAADEGAGSLRQALIESASRFPTTPSTIAFRIPGPVPDSGWFTIQPRTPLPEVRSMVKIDGSTQTTFTGDTNPDGPEIEINGALLQAGFGLLVRGGCEIQILDLAMNGFPGHAIEADREDPSPECVYVSTTLHIIRNYLGTDPRGRTAVPNERGIVLTRGWGTTIRDNLISGNRRAGIFAGGRGSAQIVRNRIGVSSDGQPLGNGASGMFLNLGAAVDENVVANNREWGICRTRAGNVSLVKNSIYDNTFQGIDVDLDFETPNVADDSRAIPNKPVLFSALYDPVENVTVVRGQLDSRVAGCYSDYRVEIYASARLSAWGQPQGERLVATLMFSVANRRDFEAAVKGDLRGHYITGTNNRTGHGGLCEAIGNTGSNTSEFSNAIRVE